MDHWNFNCKDTWLTNQYYEQVENEDIIKL